MAAETAAAAARHYMCWLSNCTGGQLGFNWFVGSPLTTDAIPCDHWTNDVLCSHCVLWSWKSGAYKDSVCRRFSENYTGSICDQIAFSITAMAFLKSVCSFLLKAGGGCLDASAWRRRAVCRLEAREWDYAINDLTQVIRLDPNDAKAFNDRGFAKARKGDFDGAIRDFDEAIRLGPYDAKACNNCGSWRKQINRTSRVKSATTEKPSVWLLT